MERGKKKRQEEVTRDAAAWSRDVRGADKGSPTAQERSFSLLISSSSSSSPLFSPSLSLSLSSQHHPGVQFFFNFFCWHFLARNCGVISDGKIETSLAQPGYVEGEVVNLNSSRQTTRTAHSFILSSLSSFSKFPLACPWLHGTFVKSGDTQLKLDTGGGGRTDDKINHKKIALKILYLLFAFAFQTLAVFLLLHEILPHRNHFLLFSLKKFSYSFYVSRPSLHLPPPSVMQFWNVPWLSSSLSIPQQSTLSLLLKLIISRYLYIKVPCRIPNSPSQKINFFLD